jgi:putative endonuclease
MAHNHTVGAWGEALAAAYLQSRGYAILARRWRLPGGELDLVARRDEALVFVEVKTRGARCGVPAEDWVGRRQQLRLRRAARAWLAAVGPDGCRDLRFDVIGVTLDADGLGFRLRHLEGAF